jgi:hypothetical protein
VGQDDRILVEPPVPPSHRYGTGTSWTS